MSLPSDPVSQPAPVDDGIDLVPLLRMLWAGRWRIALVATFFVALAWFYTSQQTPRYAAYTKVLFDLQERNIADIDEVLGSRNYDGTDLQNQVEILSSSALIERVIDKLNLQNDPYFNPTLRPEKPSRFDWLALPPEIRGILENLGVVSANAPANKTLDERRLRLAVIAEVKSGLRLAPVRGATVIQIGYVATDPRISARMANAIAGQYIVDQLEGKLEATRSATEWLSDRVLKLQEEVETSEADLAKIEARLIREAGQTLEITRTQLTELNALLGATRAKEIALTSQVERLQAALDAQTDIGSVPEFRESRLISQYRDEESELLTQEAVLRDRVGENHPSYKRLLSQLADVRNKMNAEAARVVQATRVLRDAASDEAGKLEERVNELEEKALAQSQDEITLKQLERKVNASRLLYENFLGRLQETSQQETLQSADARIITPAEVPLRALSSSKNRILAASGVLGLLLGIGLVLLLQRFNNTIRTPQDVEKEVSLPVLGSIPMIRKIGASRRELVDFFRDKPLSSLAEAIRNLRTSLLFSDFDNPPKVIMVTSSVPKEGKSSLSMLLALTSQNMGRKTIIVDCDFRLPALSTLINLDQDAPGILSLMNGETTFDEALSIDEPTGLHILMARRKETRTLKNPADVLSSQTFENLIDELRQTYDMVILDTPPVLAVSDPRIVANYADKVLYVVRWDETERGALAQGVKGLRSVGAPLVGTVMTQVDEEKAAQYSYDGYGYGYYRSNYSDYYTE